MAERSLRGMSIGAKSLESDDNVDFAARNDVAYVCPKGHRTILPFAEGAEIPDEWECRCGSVAHREGDADREGDEISKDQVLLVNLSGRGDKDIFTVHDILKARGEI